MKSQSSQNPSPGGHSVSLLAIALLSAIAALFLVACGGDASDKGQEASGSQGTSTVEAGAVAEEELPFSCPVSEAQIVEITGLDLELEHGTDKSFKTPADAMGAEPSVDVQLCGYSSATEVSPAMVNLHWSEYSGRPDLESIYQVTEHPEWGEDAFSTQGDGSEDPSIGTATLPYPGGGYWRVTAFVPNEISSTPKTAAQWAEEVGGLISGDKGNGPTPNSGTADVGESALRRQLGAMLPTQCSDVDQFVDGEGAIGASGDEISVEGVGCDSLVDLIHQISPALSDDYWRNRISAPRLDGVGAFSCYIDELKPNGVPVFCSDGRGTRVSLVLVDIPE